ncbi:MAG: 2-hydroxyacyl-CoA dehydratase [Deltaproteobacteria bacterium]|nr:2-hydroxyacyl-CoA dehydratase [Deltaproteobacteria bacterium]
MFDKSYLRNIEEHVFKKAIRFKEEGGKAVGVYCAFTPKEMIAAAGAMPITLCAGSDKTISDAEKHLPRNLCPLIKSSYGFALTDTCPFFHEVDIILADATCDGKKKMFELLSNIKPLYLLQLPQTSETDESLQYWIAELYRVKTILEELTGTVITDSALSENIRLYNGLRKVVNAVFDLNTGKTPLVYGREICNIINMSGFEIDIEWRIEEIKSAIRIIRQRGSQFGSSVSHKPRILLTGCPTTNQKVLDAIEDGGGIVVAMENCGGLKTVGDLVNENEDPLTALAKKYLSTACPCMSPNTKRFEILKNIIESYHIEGVVELTWHACHAYNVEAYSVNRFVTEICGIPYLQIETDYSQNDSGQIKVRVEAFLEMIKN